MKPFMYCVVYFLFSLGCLPSCSVFRWNQRFYLYIQVPSPTKDNNLDSSLDNHFRIQEEREVRGFPLADTFDMLCPEQVFAQQVELNFTRVMLLRESVNEAQNGRLNGARKATALSCQTRL